MQKGEGGEDETECVQRKWELGDMSVYIPADRSQLHEKGNLPKGVERGGGGRRS